MMPSRPLRVAFCGPGDPSPEEKEHAESIGERLAAAGCTVYCGGLGGSMEAVCRGAKRQGGSTVGILPVYDTAAANEWVDIPICTGMGQARNVVLVASVDVVIASGGGWGTLSEIALAVRLGRPVVVHGAWFVVAEAATDHVDRAGAGSVHLAASPQQAVEIALSLGRQARSVGQMGERE
jgi:uncharacterized protein (TIGR00725 family)